MSEKSQVKAQNSGAIEQFGYEQELHRTLKLRHVVLYGVLFMVLIAPQSIFGEIQVASHGMTPLVYIVGFIAISFTTLSYYRMSARFPIAGSVYAYVQRGINPHVGFIAGWLILMDYLFVPSLLYVMVANWGVELIPGSPWYLWIVVFLIFNTFVNIRGIHLTANVDWVIFVVEILSLIAFIYLGFKYVLNGGGYGHLAVEPLWTKGEVDAHFVATAVSIACLSFLGFDGMSTLAEETEHPEKNIGKGIIIALCAIVGVFVLQCYVAALIQPDWANTDMATGFFDSAELAGGPVFRKILLVVNIVAIGIANIMNAQTATARMLYGMGRDGVIPKIFGKVHPKYKTPYASAIFVGAGSLIIVLVLSMSQLVRLVNFGALSSFVLLNFAVFWFFFVKEKRRAKFGEIVAYFICPWCGILILGYVFTGFDAMTYVVGIVWLIIGLIIGAIKSKGYKEVPDAFKNLEV